MTDGDIIIITIILDKVYCYYYVLMRMAPRPSHHQRPELKRVSKADKSAAQFDRTSFQLSSAMASKEDSKNSKFAHGI